MLQILTKKEVEEHNAALETWWAELDWTTKNNIRQLIQGVKMNSGDFSGLPMQYADEREDMGTVTTITNRDGTVLWP